MKKYNKKDNESEEKMNKLTDNIFNNYDNKEILVITRILLNMVINDICDFNKYSMEEDILYLGNNKKIKKENFESLVSIVDTIDEVLK